MRLRTSIWRAITKVMNFDHILMTFQHESLAWTWFLPIQKRFKKWAPVHFRWDDFSMLKEENVVPSDAFLMFIFVVFWKSASRGFEPTRDFGRLFTGMRQWWLPLRHGRGCGLKGVRIEDMWNRTIPSLNVAVLYRIEGRASFFSCFFLRSALRC